MWLLGGCTWFVVTSEPEAYEHPDSEAAEPAVVGVTAPVVDTGGPVDTSVEHFGAELVAISSMSTALELHWEAEDVERVSAALWLPDGATREVDELGEVGLVLAPEEVLVSAEVAFWRDGEVVATATATATTGSLPSAGLPTITVAEGSVVEDMVVLYAISEGDDSSVTLLSGDGRPLWRLGEEALEGFTATAVEKDLGQAGVVVSRNAGAATGFSTEGEGGANDFARYDWHGEVTDTLDAPHSHHLFDQPSPGVVAWIKARREDRHGEQDVVWDQIVLSSFDDEERVVVDTATLGTFGQPCPDNGFYPDACDAHHTNSLDCRPDRGTCLLSLHNVHRVLEVSLATGALIEDWTTWRGQDESGLELTVFERAHDVHWSADGSQILVFNDAAAGGFASRLEPVVSASGLVERWGYGRDECLAAQALGTVQELPDGHHLAGFSAPNNLLREIDEAGEVLWDADFGGLDPSERCEAELGQMVLGEARALDVTALGEGVIALF